MDLNDRFIVSRALSVRETHCGYCRSNKEDKRNYFPTQSWYEKHKDDSVDIRNVSYGFQVELMSVDMYDKLVNLGFRRSGNFLYKPDLLRNCCRMYTIKTTRDMMKVTKEHKQCVKRFKKTIAPEQAEKNSGNTKNSAFDVGKEIISAELQSAGFHTRFEPPLYTNEKYELFVKYQREIHKDEETSKRSFKRFLCDAPFAQDVLVGTVDEWEQLNDWRQSPGKVSRVGPVHECYYYNGALIALAVLDFLPSGVSSVYFIWDPDYHKWGLGTLSALREMTVVEKIQRKYYYLGYYIEDCHKMKYKKKFGGEILDIVNNQFVPLEMCEPFIKGGKLFALANKDTPVDGSEPEFGSEARLDLSRPVVDVVEDIYGVNGGAYARANKSVGALDQFGIEFVPMLNGLYERRRDEGKSSVSYELPVVVPGLIPLWQIEEMLATGEFNRLNHKLMVYDQEKDGKIRMMMEFEREQTRVKHIIVNLVRLVGLKNTAKSLIII